MRQPTFVGLSITTHGGYAKVHGRMLPVAPIELAELLLGAGQTDLETLDLAEPAFRLGFGDSGDQVVADLGKPCSLGRVRSEERASDTSFSELRLEASQFRRPDRRGLVKAGAIGSRSRR
jgi:hypothetical protein